MIDLTTLAKSAGFADVIEAAKGDDFDTLEAPGVNTNDARDKFRAAFKAWAADKPKASLIVRQRPVLLGMDNGKRMVMARFAAR